MTSEFIAEDKFYEYHHLITLYMEFCREDLGYMTSVFMLGLLITTGTNLKLSMCYF